MEELQTIKFLLNRIEIQFETMDKKFKIEKEARRLSDIDEKENGRYTYWNRLKELGIDKLPNHSKQDIKDSLRLIRKLTLELEKSL